MQPSAVKLSDILPNLSRGRPRKATLAQIAGVVGLALASLSFSIFVADRTWNAHQWERHTREVQLAIDRIVWDLLALQQATQEQRLNRDAEHVERFNTIRSGIGNDIRAASRLTADNPQQYHLLAELAEIASAYLIKVDTVAASIPGSGVGRGLAAAMSIDTGRMSALIGKMRQHEDELLESRSTRADRLFAFLLPALSASTAVIVLLALIAGRSILRFARDRDRKLSEKDGQLAVNRMLMREVDHRVRNSLGLVYSLITFQQRRANIDQQTRDCLADAANQILVVARVHERLYAAEGPERLQIGEYLRDIGKDVAAYSLPEECRSAIRVTAVEVDLPAEQLIWLGLIVVELVTNALKYGSPHPNAPVEVDVAMTGDRLQVSVSDRGRGLPADFDPQASKGLGMEVVGLLVKQLRGTLQIDRDWAGARFIVTMPVAA